MNIEISGVYPANRGALLMLEAIRERIGNAFPEARLAVPLDWSPQQRLDHGVWGTPGSLRRGPSLRLMERAPWRMREATTFVPGRQVDVLLDASGFGYGDFWGLDKLRQRLTDRLDRWKHGRRRAVLLPQALGPFTEPGMADAFRAAADRLDLLYVRDARSEAFAQAVLADSSRLRRAPDFTNLLKPSLPDRLDHLRGAALIVPNEKMIAGRGEDASGRYLAFLVAAAHALQRSGRTPIVLLHEGNRDLSIAAALNDRLDRPLAVVNEPSALVTKAVIGVAELIVSSRFHGLVSALSSGVPALACGWSHKYAELMADYGRADWAVDLDSTPDPEGAIDAFVDAAADGDSRRKLVLRAEAERKKSRAMWDEVIGFLRH